MHAKIIDAQLDELRASERLHEVFTELSVAGASPDEIVRQAAILAGRPVILGTDLGSAESRTSLHVAMLAPDAPRSGR